MEYRSERDWMRLGSESATEDRDARNSGLISDADLESALEGHFDADLSNPEITEDREAAVAALVYGYKFGG